jgi:release factor glutamine methyltransferase
MTIGEIINKYKGNLDYLDIEILIAHSLDKTREFVLTYPDQAITKLQETKIKKCIARRSTGEPIAYIIGHKEFYGLDFIVNKYTLVPRPETELMVELAVQNVECEMQDATIIDIGTGSGCIIISIANKLKKNTKYYASDISEEALKIAKKNAAANGVGEKIKFLHGNLLEPLLKAKKLMSKKLFITANLPYLSKEIYATAPIDVKKFEPKSALYSGQAGLAHYHELLLQIKKMISVAPCELQVTGFFEISPEQKTLVTKLIKNIFSNAKIEFKKDLANKWRICKINLN